MSVKPAIRLPILLRQLFVAFGVVASCSLWAQTNGVVREVYYNIPGGSISDLTSAPNFPDNPDEQFVESSFEAPSQFADYYGQRMRALLVPPVTGTYVFWIASDDAGDLYLSTNEDPARKVRIAYETGWAGVREYNKTATAKSAGISLTNGFRYYIEALQKEGAGGDNLAVTWQKPGDQPPADGAAPISGQYLVPYGLGPPAIISQPADLTAIEGSPATFTIQLASKLGAGFQWSRDGQPIPGATNMAYGLPQVSVADNGSRFSCFAQNALGSTNSRMALLTVQADTTPPTISSAGSPGNPEALTVIFSEAVEALTATDPANYSISGGIKVISVSFGADSRSVILTTTPMLLNVNYTVTVSHVKDRASTPNVIIPGSQSMFLIDTPVLDLALIRPPVEPVGASSRHGPVTISEIMYHPTNRLDGRDLEFVELFNSNPYAEDISGFRVAGDIEFTIPTNTLLAARAYTVVAASPSDLTAVYGITNLLGAYTNHLPNKAGSVQLLNRQGGVLCRVDYDSVPPWPAAADGAGHSLVLSRASLGEKDPAAWAQSEVVGGSPGRAEIQIANPYRTVMINEVLAHTDPPQWDFIELFNYSGSAVDLSGCTLSDEPGTNKFTISSGTVIQPLSFVCFDELQLGFRLSSGGETVYFRDPYGERLIDCLRFGAQENGVAWGRTPDGAAQFTRLQQPTPCGANTKARVSDVVINEIMYAPISGEDDDQYLELWNRGATTVDLNGWAIYGGVRYTFPRGAAIAGGSYLVVAKNPSRLLASYPALTAANTFGGFSGALAGRGEALSLTMPDEVRSTNSSGRVETNIIHIKIDEVNYGTGGRWGVYAKGGGSSLELVDARGDHNLAANWADSDESGKSAWTTIEYTGVLQNGNTGFPADSLQIMLFGAGECLIDNLELFTPGGANRVVNPGLDSGIDAWAMQGNHERSFWQATGGYNGTGCLHLKATDRGDTGANRVRAKLTSTLSSGQTATIRAKVRWLAGCPEILFRIRGSWLEATGNILTARNLGTPGAVNTRVSPNAAPAISEVRHTPLLPGSGQPVTVMAQVNDPDGIAQLVLKYRQDPSTNFASVSMVNNGAGVYSGVIPGQAAGKLVGFHIQALDNSSVRASARFPTDAPARECLVRWGDPAQTGGFGTYRLWMTQATLDRWSQREHLSNEPLDCTLVYGNSRVVYNMGGEYSGSPWHSPGFNSPVGNICDYLLTFSDDDRFLGENDATLQWPGNGGGDNSYQREQTAYWVAEQLGLPYCYRRTINFFVNGVRRAEMFEDAQQPNADLADEFYPTGRHGDLHKIQVWYEFDDSAANFSGVGASFSSARTLPVVRWTFAKRAVQDSANNYTNLIDLMGSANYSSLGQAYRNQLEAHVDIDNWLKTFAVQHIVGNNDSFAYGGGQNMYMYRPPSDTWKMLIWDIDFAFAAQAPDSDVFQGIGRSNGIDLNEAAYLRRYWEILYDLAYGPLVATQVGPVLDRKYNAMVANGRSIENPSSIKTYISSRRSYLLGLISANVPPGFSLTLNAGSPFSTNQNLITLTGIAGANIRSITVNGVAWPLNWTSTRAWNASIALAPGTNVLVVAGFDSAGKPVSGASATMSIIYTGAGERPEDKLVMNEIQYNPLVDGASFIEILNTSAANAFDLSGWRLDGVGFVFPGGSVIAPGGFMVVAANRVAFASTYGATVPVAGEFQGNLQNNGETVTLVKPGATLATDQIISQVRYDSELPWPAAANGTGASLQLVDPRQSNNRVANWRTVVSTNAPPGTRWRYATASGTASSSTLYIYLQSAGTTFIDDLKLVAGSVPEAGANLLVDGDFESGFPGPWGVSAILSASSLSSVTKHSGSYGLKIVSTSAGSSRSTSIYQDITPYLTLGAPYTLSFWYLESTNAGTLTVRLSGNGIVSNVALDGSVGTPPAEATPGRANSITDGLVTLPLLWLNEICPSNSAGLTDRFGHRHAWVELYNNSATNLNLAGCFLANNYSNLLQWPFPTGASLASSNFMVVWLDGNVAESSPSEFHAGFSVPTQVGSIALVQTNGGQTNILDYLNYRVMSADRSYGAFPDGHPSKRQLFYYPTPGATNNPAAPKLQVAINEWMADNVGTAADPADNSFEDWFELYNYGEFSADLGGYYLSSTLTNKTKFKIPDGYVIPPQGFLLVWADNDPGQNGTNQPDLHVNFKLARAGEAIGLFAPDGTTIDYVAFGPQAPDVSEGRFPDGGISVWAQTYPTPFGPNFVEQPNRPPQIMPLTDHAVFEGQLLLLQATASDPDQPRQTLWFSLDPGCPTNAAIQGETGLISWRPEAYQAPGTNTFTVRVTDDGSPPSSATTTFSVAVFQRPAVTDFRSLSTGGFRFSFGTVPGRSYQVEFKDDLTDTDWQVLLPAEVGLGASVIVNDPTVRNQRFYRVVVLN